MAVKSPVTSNLNPNAPQFVPSSYLMVEDFSPEWWRLVQTSPAFRDYWICERQPVLEEDDVSLPDELFDTVDGEYVLETPLEDDHSLEIPAFVEDTEAFGQPVEFGNGEDQKPQVSSAYDMKTLIASLQNGDTKAKLSGRHDSHSYLNKPAKIVSDGSRISAHRRIQQPR